MKRKNNNKIQVWLLHPALACGLRGKSFCSRFKQPWRMASFINYKDGFLASPLTVTLP